MNIIFYGVELRVCFKLKEGSKIAKSKNLNRWILLNLILYNRKGKQDQNRKLQSKLKDFTHIIYNIKCIYNSATTQSLKF
jgi:hypothetical protein